ncbi:MAG: AbrB/MazE/SpoVT family DNA-binding domain-containing protein [Nitrospirae bacterium]|nr:MAG: AbrB/MazE/SpoVT family DNA-binding domain-containing protein [Nitrospirota bacterium]
MLITAKVTSKGQVTIPKEIRKALNSDVIEFELRNNEVILRAVESVAGSLNSYSKREERAFREVREKVWQEVVNEKTRKTA